MKEGGRGRKKESARERERKKERKKEKDQAVDNGEKINPAQLHTLLTTKQGFSPTTFFKL